ncbi:forkhead domain protein [Aspergillus clavatus NRRL 1]|uniref:Forkhead domain protein n=1 Tax=Aspergillus clavatus (strain ATCC 1007 / CBS 513.65 / DSM 816 / NCTC 3887 / NRRL 1 / QM 1276 / 107) TaxID=344612 RepID=A1CF32_ASPCL|nr:forkhead domain protein [Aspergillus clavatus NRRL 1]EAW11481.1 forkhead domain protein [Aspergillus clavatus NRRL 1]
MDHSIPSHEFFAKYTDEGAMHHHAPQPSSSPLSDGSYQDNPPYSDPCSPTWAHSVSNSPETLEVSIPEQKAWGHETAQIYTLSSSTSPLETSADGSSQWYPYYDKEPSRAMASYSNSDQGTAQLRGPSVSQSPSDWKPGVESQNRIGFDAQSYYASSQVPGSFSEHSEIRISSQPATSLASSVPSFPTPSQLPTQPSHSDHMEIKRAVDLGETRDTPDSTEDSSLDAPYSHLIYEALMNAPDKKLPLQGVYSWFEKHTTKGKDQNSKGWQNSIRHNLSMNAGFEAVKGEATGGKKAMNYWRLTDEAIKKGIQSTTRYRKQANHKRSLGSDPPAPQRQRSGAKGGKATKITAKYRGQMLIVTGQADAQREQLRHQPVAPLQPQPMGSYYHPYSLQTTTSTAIVAPTHVSDPATLMPRLSVEQYGLSSAIGCSEAPPCSPLFYDMTGPCVEYYPAYETGLGGWCGVRSHPTPNGLPHASSGWWTGLEMSPDLKLSV